MADSKAKTAREQILDLHKAMADDQVKLAKDLLDLLGNDDVAGLVRVLVGLQARAIPGSTLDHQIGSFAQQIGNLAQTTAQVYQQLVAQQAQAQK